MLVDPGPREWPLPARVELNKSSPVADRLQTVSAGPSIYDFVRAHLDPAGRLDEPGLSLPDEARVMSGGLRWTAGAMDGAFGHHFGGGRAEGRAAEIAALLVKACKRPSKRNLTRLYEAVSADRVLNFVDPMIEKLAELRPDRADLHALGRWLATTGSDRGAVKVGIAILGVTGLDADVDVVRALGAHEEFTLFAAVALDNGLAEPETELWSLASVVDGWGRIQCVERLRNTQDPQIRAWILRQGFRNSIMYEYLAFIAATTGGLLPALEEADPDRELLTAAGEIIEALIIGGPAEDLDDYDAGADAVEAFLRHMETRAETLGDFHAVAAILRYLAQDDGWDERSGRGWTASRREVFEARCSEILERDEWQDRIDVGLLSDNPAEFWRADQAARHRGIDTFDIHVGKIREDPLGGTWFDAWQQADRPRAQQLVELVRQLLPLDEIGTGPSDALGMGPEWRAHTALDWTLQALRDHEAVGSDLVLVGLRSPVVRNRNMSLNILKEWSPATWPAGARELAEDLAKGDPDEKVRGFAAEVLRGESDDTS
jgi:hypothetical protein